MNESLNDIKIVSIKEFQDNFDDYIKKIEVLRQSFVIETEGGERAVIMPSDGKSIKIDVE